MSKLTKLFAGGACAAAMSFAMAAGPVDAAGNQRGLVNVYAEDTTVQIPIGVAANVCGVNVAVLAQAADLTGVECTAEGVSLANAPSDGSGPVNQNGLVNVALVDTTVQVPVSVAANICDVTVAVLSGVLDTPPATLCDAAANAAGNA